MLVSMEQPAGGQDNLNPFASMIMKLYLERKSPASQLNFQPPVQLNLTWGLSSL